MVRESAEKRDGFEPTRRMWMKESQTDKKELLTTQSGKTLRAAVSNIRFVRATWRGTIGVQKVGVREKG